MQTYSSSVLWIFCSVVSEVFLFSVEIGKPGSGITRLERFEGSCGMRNLTLIYNYMNVRVDGTKVYLNWAFTLKRDVTQDITFHIHLEKCEVAENLDTCEQIFDVKKDHACTFLTPNNPIVGPVLTAIEPQFQCPLKKGFYQANDSMVDIALFIAIPSRPQYWKLKLQVLVPGKIIGCCAAESHVVKKWLDE